MIRINLLPIRQQQRRTAGRMQLLIFVGALLLEAALILTIWSATSSEVEELQAQVNQARADVEKAKSEIQDAQQLEARAEQLRQQLAVLEQLETKRSGPVRVLDELQAIMSPPRDQESRFAQLKKNWNVEWEPGRLWLGSFKEDAGAFEVVGSAVSPDDVAEFLHRLNTADHFRDVQLDYVKAATGQGGAGSLQRYVTFRVTGNLTYSPGPEAGAAAPAAPAGG